MNTLNQKNAQENYFSLIKKEFPYLTLKQCDFMGGNFGRMFNMSWFTPMFVLYTHLFCYPEEIIDSYYDSKVFVEILDTNMGNYKRDQKVAFIVHLENLRFDVIYLEKDKKHKIEKVGKKIFISSTF